MRKSNYDSLYDQYKMKDEEFLKSITVDNGYEIDSVLITVAGVDVTQDVYNNGSITNYKALVKSLTFSNEKIKKDLGFVPTDVLSNFIIK